MTPNAKTKCPEFIGRPECPLCQADSDSSAEARAWARIEAGNPDGAVPLLLAARRREVRQRQLRASRLTPLGAVLLAAAFALDGCDVHTGDAATDNDCDVCAGDEALEDDALLSVDEYTAPSSPAWPTDRLCGLPPAMIPLDETTGCDPADEACTWCAPGQAAALLGCTFANGHNPPGDTCYFGRAGDVRAFIACNWSGAQGWSEPRPSILGHTGKPEPEVNCDWPPDCALLDPAAVPCPPTPR